MAREKLIKISEKDLLDLIHWARRYCDYRSTYVSKDFNEIYETIKRNNPAIQDRFDSILMNEGAYWPHAQDGMFNPRTLSYDARPIGSIKRENHEIDEG